MTDSDDGDEWTREDSERLAEEIELILIQVAHLDRERLKRARRELKKFESAAPIVDPTAYMERGDANQRALERLDAVIEFYDALDISELAEGREDLEA